MSHTLPSYTSPNGYIKNVNERNQKVNKKFKFTKTF